jgi:hypothetical protein
MEYVRVRKDTLKDVEGLLRRRNKADWHVVAAIVGLVIAVALAGLAVAL